MKLRLLADESGRIVAAHFSSPTIPLPPPSSPTSTRISPSKGQSLQEVEVPAELEPHVLQNTFPKEISKWKVERHGKTAKLVRA
jgi:hypothetical protein